jgi:hypothetical protein
VILLVFILKKIIFDEEEGRQGLEGGDGGDRVAELGVQAAQGIDHQGQFGDRVANIVEQITELLEMPKVISDGKITLEQAMEIL